VEIPDWRTTLKKAVGGCFKAPWGWTLFRKAADASLEVLE